MAWAKSTGDARLDAALKRATEEGLVAPQEVHMLIAQAGTGGLRSGDNTRRQQHGALHGQPAHVLACCGANRSQPRSCSAAGVTFVAAYRTAQQPKMADPRLRQAGRAETRSSSTKGNRPQWARRAGRDAVHLQQYSISYLGLLQRMWMAGEEGSKSERPAAGPCCFAMAMLLPGRRCRQAPVHGGRRGTWLMPWRRLGYNLYAKQAP